MHDIVKKTIERAILVAVDTKTYKRDVVEEHLDELEELAATAGAETIFKIIQDRHSIESAFYIGKGKAEEIRDLVELNEIDLVIFDDDLSAMQVRNLEKMINKKIIDRSGLILDIFASRAKTKEAKTQVELAQLEYMLPRLTRAWTHLSKQYGGIGTKGPGETQIETDRRIIRTRIAMLKEKLKKIEAHRDTQSQKRKELLRVTTVGYTNAGKSTLFNLLTQSDVFAEDKLFATLDSTTRVLELESNVNMLLSDTVGFIRKLPHHLVASFKSTLNEVRDADVVLHVVDVAHPFYEEHIEVVKQTLKDLDCHEKPAILVFNKIDLIKDKDKIEFIKNKYKGCVIISAERGINISALQKKIIDEAENAFVNGKIKLDLTDGKTAALIHTLAEVTSVKYDEKYIHINYRTNKENTEKIKKLTHGKKSKN